MAALKLINASATPNGTALNEAKTLADISSRSQLSSSHFLKFNNHFNIQDRDRIHTVLVSEVMGPSLQAVRSVEDEVVKMSYQMLGAMAPLHKIGIVHWGEFGVIPVTSSTFVR